MIGTIFTLTNQNSDVVKFNDHVTDPDNFIALQVYPTFDIEVRNEEIVKEGQHGVWDFFSFYGKRLIIFEGIIVAENEGEAHRLREQILLVTQLPPQPASGDDGTVTIEWTDPLGRDVQLDAKLAAPPRFSRPLGQREILSFILEMKSASPIIETQDLIEDAGLRSYQTGSIRLPFKMTEKIDILRRETFMVTNGGNTTADTVIRLYGSPNHVITNPRITNQTTGKFMQVNVTLTDQTKYVALNSKTGQVLDQDLVDRSGNLETGSEFITLNVGANTLYFTSVESGGASALNPLVTRVYPVEVVEVDHRDAII